MRKHQIVAERLTHTLSEVAFFQEKLRLAATETGVHLDDRTRELAIDVLEKMKRPWSDLPPVKFSDDELAAMERMQQAFHGSSIPYVDGPAKRIVDSLREAQQA